MKAAIAFVVSILWPVLYVLILLGAGLGLVVGVMLLIDSARVMRWNAYLNRWISTENAARVLDRSRDVKHFVYRRHRVVGLLVIAGSLFALDVLAFGLRTTPLLRALRPLGNPTAGQTGNIRPPCPTSRSMSRITGRTLLCAITRSWWVLSLPPAASSYWPAWGSRGGSKEFTK